MSMNNIYVSRLFTMSATTEKLEIILSSANPSVKNGNLVWKLIVMAIAVNRILNHSIKLFVRISC